MILDGDDRAKVVDLFHAAECDLACDLTLANIADPGRVTAGERHQRANDTDCTLRLIPSMFGLGILSIGGDEVSIRKGLLAMLDSGPRYGAQLRTEFEARTGATWPLNVGQVYTTLARLDRDGLVEADGQDRGGHISYRITEAGSQEVAQWFASPVEREAPARDELAIKLAFAVTVPGLDVRSLIGRQRTATLGALQDYTALKDSRFDDPDELPWLLVLESLIFGAEAEVRWLDHVEARVARAAEQRAGADAPARTSSRQRVSR